VLLLLLQGGGAPGTGGTGPTTFQAELVAGEWESAEVSDDDVEWATAELYDDPEV
jgi:hypothetical protein